MLYWRESSGEFRQRAVTAPCHDALDHGLQPVIAKNELDTLQAAVASTRTLLASLQHQATTAEQAADLRQVNERLIVVALGAEHDSLTGLPNRLLLLDRFAVALANARRHRLRLALLFLDLNNFKHINDSFGHETGDLVLKHVAQELTSALRSGDTASRHGGDEFLVLLGEVALPADAAIVADKIVALLGAATQIGQNLMRVTVSIGISVFPDDGDTVSDLIACADKAMYLAKARGLAGYAFHGDPIVSEQTVQLPALILSPGSATGVKGREASAAPLHEAQRRHREILEAVAHELRDPRWPRRIARGLMAPLQQDESALPRITRIIEIQLGNMSRFVDEKLNLSRDYLEQVQPLAPHFNLSILAQEAVDVQMPNIRKRRQRLHAQLSAGTVSMTKHSAGLKQMFCCLLENASKYTPNGGRIDVALLRSDANIVISVADSGFGLSAVAIEDLLFEPFENVAEALQSERQAARSGMKMVRQFVRLHNGTLAIKSGGKDLGSEFAVSLPLSLFSTEAS